MTNLLEIRGLTRRFGGLTAVNAVDLDVAEGELVSIIGPNGAGKTTLFNLVTDLDDPDEGTVKLAGEDVTQLSADKLAGLGLHMREGSGVLGKQVGEAFDFLDGAPGSL